MSILICPFYGVGHITPTLMLAKKLVSQGIKVIFIFPGKMLYERVAAGKNLDALGINFVLLDFQDEFDTISNARMVAAGLRRVYFPSDGSHTFSTILSTRLQIIRQKIDQLKAVHTLSAAIFGSPMFFQGILMKNLDFPVYSFSAISAMSTAVLTHVTLNATVDDQGMLQVPEHIDHLPPLRAYDFDHNNPADAIANIILNSLYWAASSSGLVVNTFEEMEPGPLEACRRLYKKVFAVGPLLELGGEGAVFSSFQEDICKVWLEKQTPRSVLFICFGSWLQLNEHQLHELALGVEASGHKFMWILPDKCEEVEWMKDFKERTSQQGLIVNGWGPQQMILSHPSVGGSIVTCGWNSVLESIALGGVPLIAWPFYGDHLPTCRYLVDGAKVAVEVEDQNGLVDRHEVLRAIKLIMSGCDLYTRAQQLKQAAEDAVNGRLILC